jgi:RP/EB family microtubule-associated protein
MIASSGSSAPAPRPSAASARAPAARAPVGAAGARAPSAASAAQINQLNAQVIEMQAQCEGLEKERDFYFAKLRSIELIVGDRINLDHIDPEERDTLAKIQEVLYQTEDGFEVGPARRAHLSVAE